jgi:hypothetical protein
MYKFNLSEYTTLKSDPIYLSINLYLPDVQQNSYNKYIFPTVNDF